MKNTSFLFKYTRYGQIKYFSNEKEILSRKYLSIKNFEGTIL